MNNEDDKTSLQELRALEHVLFRENDEIHTETEYSLCKVKTEVIHDLDHSQVKIEHVQEDEGISQYAPVPESDPLIVNEIPTDSFDVAVHLNKQLIQLLFVAREKISITLEECKRKKGIVDQKLKQYLKTDANTKITLNAGMPYFKDKNCCAAPPNEDTKLKEARGEFQIMNLRRTSHWTEKDKDLLVKSIQLEVIEDLKRLPGNEKIDLKSIQTCKNNTLLQLIFREIGQLGAREFNWTKIAKINFKNKHSPEECRNMWNIYLHPSNNKQNWRRQELVDLEKYMRQFKNQNWDAIAQKIGTNKSGYQYFMKYNSMKTERQCDRTWSKHEDHRLMYLVKKFKTGDFINWGEIPRYMESRTTSQVYYRWMYNLAPHLKKGRFTMREDHIFEEAIEKYGLNFERISALAMPTRTPMQLSYHYGVMRLNEIKNLDETDLEIIHHFQNAHIPTRKVEPKKFYTPSELNSATRKMYNILNLLSANLTIPDDLNKFDCLNELDKQILFSLKHFPRNAIDGTISRQIEETRLRMFANSDSKSENHFVPPVPFEDFTENSKTNYVIDYNLPPRIRVYHSLPINSSTQISSADVDSCTKYQEFDMENFPSLKPCHWTLLGYQGFKRVRKLFSTTKKKNLTADSRKVSTNSRKSLITLRTRLVQLFEFPVVMSTIIPSESLKDRDPLIDDVNQTSKQDSTSRKRTIFIKVQPK